MPFDNLGWKLGISVPGASLIYSMNSLGTIDLPIRNQLLSFPFSFSFTSLYEWVKYGWDLNLR